MIKEKIYVSTVVCLATAIMREVIDRPRRLWFMYRSTTSVIEYSIL